MFFSAFGENQNEMLITYMDKEILCTLSATKKNPNLELLTLMFLKDIFHLGHLWTLSHSSIHLITIIA